MVYNPACKTDSFLCYLVALDIQAIHYEFLYQRIECVLKNKLLAFIIKIFLFVPELHVD